MKKYTINIVFIVFACLLFFVSCSSSKGIKKKDKLGRVTRISYYDGSRVDRIEKIKYYGNSHNPLKKLYLKEGDDKFEKVKEVNYLFKGNNLVKITFSVYRDKHKIDTGMIKYYYMRDRFRRIEYYSFIETKNKMYIFGLDQYTYEHNSTHSRRIIEYEYNPGTDRSMQIKQYVVYYKAGKINRMKSWFMDKKSKKIIEKIDENSKSVEQLTSGINKNYEKRARAEEFLQR